MYVNSSEIATFLLAVRQIAGASRASSSTATDAKPLPVLAGIFRSGPRSPSTSFGPPVSYPRGLQPVASRDVLGASNGGVSPRLSRTDLDFESALRAEGTVRLKEGLDMASLGVVEGSPSTPRRATPSSNLVIVPPTPEAHSSTSQGSSTQCDPSPSPNSVHDQDSIELQNKRRSMYRSAGSASSPDLATLLRKAKENGGVISTNGASRLEGADLAPNDAGGTSFLSPSHNSPRLRGSSSTSSFSVVSAGSANAPRIPAKATAAEPDRSTRDKGADKGDTQKSEWSMTSPRARSGSKSGKSMRSRATNFFGKMLGQESTREKYEPDTPSTPVYTAPPLFAHFTNHGDSPPPVPRLPEPYRFPGLSPSRPSDVSHSAPTSPDYSKPLPPITSLTNKPTREDEIEALVSAAPTPERTIKSRPREGHFRSQGSTSSVRRRSASVGDLERQKVIAEAADSLPTPAEPGHTGDPGKVTEWDTNGIMSLFKGELSQIEAPLSSTSLEIKDPSTPQRRARSNTDQTLPAPNEGVSSVSPRLAESSSSSIPPTASGVTQTGRSSLEAPARRSPAAIKRSSLISPAERPSTRRTVSRPTPPVSALQFMSPRTVSTPIPGIPTASSPSGKLRGATAPPAFINPFMSQTSVASNGAAAVPRDAMQLRERASSSEPVLLSGGEAGAGLRRNSQPQSQNSDFQRTVRLVPSTLSAYPTNIRTSGSASRADIGPNDSQGRAQTSSSPKRGVSLENDDIETRGQELARRCWMDDEKFLSKEKIAEWLGAAGRINAVALHHYIEFYDFTGLRLDHAFRRFCAKLYLKGETQQIDRILSEFSRRYWECNPNSLYGSASVVHAVAYSILLLNTDLHIADLSTHMSRNQFVRNTVQAIQSQIQRASTPDLTYDDGSSDTGGNTVRSRSKRSSSVHSWTSISRDVPGTPSAGTSTSQLTASPTGPASLNASTASVQTPTSGQMSTSEPEPRIRTAGSQSSSSVTSIVYGRNWDIEMESMLRDMYTAIKTAEIRQPEGFQLPSNQMSTLAPNTPYNTLMRHRSQRGGQDRMTMLKRGSIRGIQTLLGQQAGASPYSSNSSIDGRDPRDGRVSPSPSFATSLDGIATTASTFFATPALGFASNLSHTIIRETQEDDVRSVRSDISADTSVSISDEELALLGAPWAKEGMLCRKQYWESAGKRAKSKAWQDVFVVIQKGELDMFIFGEGGAGGAENVGGGNWLANAHAVGNVVLAHSLAHVLPPPGYNRQRPYCFVLTLASGGVYFFQAGTEDLLNEWVSTCNYWAARQSKEPLSGGVSNMEYGWNRVLDPVTQTATIHDEDAASVAEPSDAFSIRSGKSFKKRSWPDPGTLGRHSDRVHINEWKPPLPSTVSSSHDEETQLEALQKQVVSLKKDLQTHNELRKPMTALYAPRSNNLAKAQTNWEKRSQHLLTEIVKYETYVESLKTAMSLRLKRRGEKALERALVTAAPADQEESHTGGQQRFAGFLEEDTIVEGEEPSTPGSAIGPRHRREIAAVAVDDAETP